MNKQITVALLLFLGSTLSLFSQNEACQIEILSSTFPSVVSPNQTLSFEATVKNVGTTTTTPTNIGLYQFLGGSRFPGRRPNLKANTLISSLAPNEEKTVSIKVTMDSPLYNRSTVFLNNNEFALIMEEDAETPNRWFSCNFPVKFEIDFQDVDLALTIINDLGCIGTDNLNRADLQLKNVGNTTVKAPIYVNVGGTSFANEKAEGVTFFFPVAIAYWIIKEDIPPGAVRTLGRPFKAPTDGIEEWTNNASIDEFLSNIEDLNPDNNKVSKTFIRTADCDGGQGESANCDALQFKVNVADIIVSGLTTAFHKLQIIGAGTNWQVQTICENNCGKTQAIFDLTPGEYTVKVQLNGLDGSNCYREEKVTIATNSANADSCAIEIIGFEVPEIVKPGQTINVSATLKNKANIPTELFEFGLYQRRGGSRLPGPIPNLLDNNSLQIIKLAAGEERQVEFAVQLPNSLYRTSNYFGPNDIQLIAFGKDDGNTYLGKRFCASQPVDLNIKYPEIDLSLTFTEGCIGKDDIVETELLLKNESTETINSIIAIGFSKDCPTMNFSSSEATKGTFNCFVPNSSIPQWTIDEPILPGEIVRLKNPFKFRFSEITVVARIFEPGSLLDDPNTSNNEAIMTFLREDNCGANSIIDCDQLQFIPTEGQIEVQNVLPTSKIEIIGKNTDWQIVTICDGNCNENQIIPNLSAGEYTVKVNQFGTDGTYCYREENIQVGDDNGAGNNNADFTCDELNFTANNGQMLVENLNPNDSKVEYIGRNTNWVSQLVCEGEYTVKVNQFGTDGTYCYREENIQVGDDNGAGNNNADFTCEELNFTTSDEQILVKNLNPNDSKVEYIGRNTNWIPQLVCEGNCQSNQPITNLSDGEYTVKINQRQQDGNYCYREMKVSVGAGSRAGEKTNPTLQLFPNPVKNSFYLAPPFLEGQSGSLLIYNTFGQRVYENDGVIFHKEVLEIDASSLENGLYYLFINVTGRRAFSQKFVKETYK